MHAQQPGQPGAARIPAGRVGRAHGLDGSFYVTQPKARLLKLGAAVTVAGASAAIVRRAGTDARPILRLEGVSDRGAAEALRGAELTVDSREAPSLAEGEWWAHELEGCAVFEGELLIGTVERMIELPSCEALEITPASGGTALIVPMVRDAVLEVSPDRRRIVVDLDFLGAGARRSEAAEGERKGEGGP